MNGRVRRAIFLVHRWLGIVLSLLMAVWALSGVVMMYVSFPETTVQERLSGLEPLNLADCCANGAMPQGDGYVSASLEMLQGRPILRLSDDRGSWMVDPGDGMVPVVDVQSAGEIARDHRLRLDAAEAMYGTDRIDRDQWTVYGRFRQYHPLYRVSFADDAGTTLYVSGATGEVVQDTTAYERFWNWLGAVPHWLYFTAFREQQGLWYNSVVYASLLGVFLTVTGIYIGIRQYGRGARRIPYRGWAWWHHVTGLAFGLFTLTWVASGLFSMNPWGWMEGEGPNREMAALAGGSISGEDIGQLVFALRDHPQSGIVRAELSIQDGTAWAILSDGEGTRRRARLADLSPAVLDDAQLADLAGRAKPGIPVATQELITEPDAYHYGHHDAVVLPAWRVIYADAQQTRLYFDPATGELINKVDAGSRAFRWFHLGLHRLDFAQSLRARPVWDVVMLPLMLGVSFLCLIGFVVGVIRLKRMRRPKV